MIQLQIISGRMAGGHWTTRHLPVRIGREPAADLRLEEAGVWDRHAELALDADGSFIIRAQDNALVSVNGQPATVTRLRNGDLIALGSVQLRFSLANPQQKSMGLREWAVWLLVAGVTAAEIVLVYQFLK